MSSSNTFQREDPCGFSPRPAQRGTRCWCARAGDRWWWAVTGRKASLFLSCVRLFTGGEQHQNGVTARGSGRSVLVAIQAVPPPAHHLQQTPFWVGWAPLEGPSCPPPTREKPKARLATWIAYDGACASFWVCYCIFGTWPSLHPPLTSSRGGVCVCVWKSWKNTFPRQFLCV